jgi:hypothetical protein
LPNSQALLSAQILDLFLNIVELPNEVQRLLGHGALANLMEIKEFTPGMRKTANLDDPILLELFIPSIVIRYKCPSLTIGIEPMQSTLN